MFIIIISLTALTFKLNDFLGTADDRAAASPAPASRLPPAALRRRTGGCSLLYE